MKKQCMYCEKTVEYLTGTFTCEDCSGYGDGRYNIVIKTGYDPITGEPIGDIRLEGILKVNGKNIIIEPIGAIERI